MKHQLGKSTVVFVIIGIIAIGIGLLAQSISQRPEPLPEFKKTIILPTPKALEMVGFKDHLGHDFGIEQFKGKWTIVFFGFTNCPDICPTTMQTLSNVKKQLTEASAWGNYRVTMVSVDPERDTPQRLGQYVPYFDSEFVGLSASIKDTEAFAKQVGVLFIKREADAAGAYDVDHGTAMILINPQGQYAGVIPAPHQAEKISADLLKFAEYTGPLPPVTTRPVQPETSKVKDTSRLLTLENAWIRPAPPGARSMAAYFNIRNQSESDINIVGAMSPSFDMAMIHDTVIDEKGMASMQHLDGLIVPAKSVKQLVPMATHMMLVGPEKDLVEGDVVLVTLSDEHDKKYEFSIPVRELGSE